MSIRYEIENRSMNLRAVIKDKHGFDVNGLVIRFFVNLWDMKSGELLEINVFKTMDEAKTAADRAVKGWID